MPETKLVKIYNDGYLEFYIFKIISSLLHSQTKRQSKLCDIESISVHISEENAIDARIELSNVKKVLEAQYWYDKKIFELYLQEGSYRKVQKVTGIGYNSIEDTVRKVRKALNGIKRESKS